MIPTVTAPTYEVKLQSIKQPVKYRPYLVKEEKILLMASEGGDEAEIERAMKDVIRACTFGAIDPDALPSFDLELLFVSLRARSVNNIVEIRYECKNVPPSTTVTPGEGDGVCHQIETIKVDLDAIKVTVPEGHTKKVMVTDTLGCMMRYPTDEVAHVFKSSKITDPVALIANCIESIFDTSGEVYETKDAKPEDVVGFIESLTLGEVEKFRSFFETLPHLEHTFAFTCSKCGYTESIVLTGLMDFFD